MSDEIIPIKLHQSSFEDYVPNQGGSEEWFSINIDTINQNTFSIVVRAIDSNNNIGDWSQILTVKTDKVFILAPQLRHYYHVEVKSEFLENKLLVEESKENFYWNIINFIIGKKLIWY